MPWKLSVPVPVKGGWKPTFSTGLTASFAKEAKEGNLYFKETEIDSIVTLMQNEDKNQIRPGLAAMMHVYRRTGTDFAFGGMFGIGTNFKSLDDLDLSLYLGCSAILGKQRKFVISGGVSSLSVSRIKMPEYKLGNNYPAGEIRVEDITEKVLRISPFISVSYTLAEKEEVK